MSTRDFTPPAVERRQPPITLRNMAVAYREHCAQNGPTTPVTRRVIEVPAAPVLMRQRRFATQGIGVFIPPTPNSSITPMSSPHTSSDSHLPGHRSPITSPSNQSNGTT